MAYLGKYFVYAAAACSLASGILYLLAWRGAENLLRSARQLFRMTALLLAAAVVALLSLFLTHDFSVAYVYSYSSSDLPWYYLVSGIWGGQDGTFLLWVMLAAIMGLVVIATGKQFEKGNMFFLNLFLLSILLILIKKSPFALMPVAQTEGAGLNPLLQNFWMTIHPPIMFVGFAASVIPFCYAMTALVERRYNIWAEAARRWTIFAWISIGVATVMGSYWAYETLGWGGFWGWDPVENASLIPWIFLTALIHALFVKQQRRGLMRFSLVMVFLSFWSIIYGTFLTRSGVLADFSVHSFVDLGINRYLIGSLIFFAVMGVFLLLWRWRDISPEPAFSTVDSRTYLTALGVVVIFVGGLLVLLGTSAPLITRLLENPSAVDLSYYYLTMTPVAIVSLILITLFPAFRWSRGLVRPAVLVIGVIGFVVTTAWLAITGVTTHVTYLLLFGVGVAALITNGCLFVRLLFRRRLRPGYLCHIGLAAALIGAGASTGLESKVRLDLIQGKSVNALGYDLTFADIIDHNYLATVPGFDCLVRVDDGYSNFVAVLEHKYTGESTGWMKAPFVKSHFSHDLYLSPVSLEQLDTDSGQKMYLRKGESGTVDKYRVTFHDFEVGEHDDIGGGIAVGVVLEMAYDDTSEIVTPTLRMVGSEFNAEAAAFDDHQANVHVDAVRPEEGAVMIVVTGNMASSEESQAPVLVIELSRKPLILLFWLGTILVFVGGGISLVQRGRTEDNNDATSVLS